MVEMKKMEKSQLNKFKFELLLLFFTEIEVHTELFDYKYKHLLSNIHLCEKLAKDLIYSIRINVLSELNKTNFLELNSDLSSFLYTEFYNQIILSSKDWEDKGEMSFFIERIIRNVIHELRESRSILNKTLRNRSISNMDYDFGLKLFTIPVEKSLPYKIDNRIIFIKLKCPRVGHILKLGYIDMVRFHEKIRQSRNNNTSKELN